MYEHRGHGPRRDHTAANRPTHLLEPAGMVHEPLPWWEKAPLFFVVAAQVLVVYRWYTQRPVPAVVEIGFGICAALALDLVVVSTTMGRRAGRSSFWSWLTPFAAMVFSALVALDAYGAVQLQAWLHAAYPVVAFIYAQHLARPRQHTATVPPPTASELTTQVNIRRCPDPDLPHDAADPVSVLPDHAATSHDAASL